VKGKNQKRRNPTQKKGETKTRRRKKQKKKERRKNLEMGRKNRKNLLTPKKTGGAWHLVVATGRGLIFFGGVLSQRLFSPYPRFSTTF